MNRVRIGVAVVTTTLVTALTGGSSKTEPGQLITAFAAASLFASNTLVIAVAPGNLKSITSFADLAQKFVDLVAAEAGRKVLTRAGFGTP